MAERDAQLANLARELHATRKFSPAQIRNRAGFLDSNDQPYIPLETIQQWLNGSDAPSPAGHAAAAPRAQADAARAPHANVALLEYATGR